MSTTLTRPRPATSKPRPTRSGPTKDRSAKDRSATPRPASTTRRSRAVVKTPAARWPFAVLLALLAAGGVITLLMVNTATAETSFTLQEKQAQLDELTQKQQSLQKKVSAQEAPEVLAKKAAELGMVPGPQPGYFILNPDGSFTFVDAPEGQPAPAPAPAAAPDESTPAEND